MIIRSNGIETVCHQKNPSNDVKYITHIQSLLAKKLKCTHNEKEESCKNNMVSSKNDTVVLKMIYKSTLKCSDSSRLW